ncbi:MAG: GAF domain-containing protein [Myxococcota bacterium]
MSVDAETTQAWLSDFLAAQGAVAGTVHGVCAKDPDVLELRAAVNIPPKVQEITATVPKGKGMAGLAYDRMQPVSTCNLKTDETGDVRPGAKAVDAQAAVALPVVRGGTLVAVVGLAWVDGRDTPESMLEALTAAAADVPVG